ncbi:hypothetical protein [Flammeovirga aprica]|uniref:Lipoprotein n=1 Tax=Flammeovirga aprica JL-4 TaxID=694437 RepID=A0A7X9P2J1_9BACT|nr:hypothetical protein [Flammeovirga aprica]NME67993.1 hypothetical protein [Flammeovirga aprica JL-4]
MKNFKLYTSTLIIATFAIFLSGCSNRNELKEKGIRSTAIVVDGQSVEREGKSTTYEIEIEFKTEKGQKVRVKESVSGSEYDKVYLNCEVPIVYLPDSPKTVDVVISGNDALFYHGIKNRSLSLEDLYNVYGASNNDSLISHLNKASFRWVSKKNEAVEYWENENRKEVVAIDEGVLTYVTYDFNYRKNFNEELEKEGYIKIEKDSTGTEIFQNDHYKIATTRKLESKDGQMGLSMYYIINVVKTDIDLSEL